MAKIEKGTFDEGEKGKPTQEMIWIDPLGLYDDARAKASKELGRAMKEVQRNFKYLNSVKAKKVEEGKILLQIADSDVKEIRQKEAALDEGFSFDEIQNLLVDINRAKRLIEENEKYFSGQVSSRLVDLDAIGRGVKKRAQEKARFILGWAFREVGRVRGDMSKDEQVVTDAKVQNIKNRLKSMNLDYYIHHDYLAEFKGDYDQLTSVLKKLHSKSPGSQHTPPSTNVKQIGLALHNYQNPNQS